MTLNYTCGNNEALVTYLYDECEPGERDTIAAHIAMCARCAEELASLVETRGELAAWTPPNTQLGFRIVSDEPVASGTGLQVASAFRRKNPGWWQQPMPAWAQAAAAVLIFAAGAGLGTLRSTSPVTAPANAVATAPTTREVATASAQDLAALEQRLRAEMQRLQPVGTAAPQAASTAAVPGATLQQVRGLIAESEVRQQKELTLRTAEVIRDFDTQRRGDLARIQQTFGRLEGTTAAEVEQQRQTLNYLMRVSQTSR